MPEFRQRHLMNFLILAENTYTRKRMITADNRGEYYQALLDKNPEYEGVFYVGVKTTGVFCRPTCAASYYGEKKKPKLHLGFLKFEIRIKGKV